MLDFIENGRNKITHRFLWVKCYELQPILEGKGVFAKSLPPAKETCDGHLLGNGRGPTVINIQLIIVTCISK